jgi:hypothetical protein
VAVIRPREAAEILGPLSLSDDEDVVEAVDEALALAGGALVEDDDDYDDYDDDEEDEEDEDLPS